MAALRLHTDTLQLDNFVQRQPVHACVCVCVCGQPLETRGTVASAVDFVQYGAFADAQA